MAEHHSTTSIGVSLFWILTIVHIAMQEEIHCPVIPTGCTCEENGRVIRCRGNTIIGTKMPTFPDTMRQLYFDDPDCNLGEIPDHAFHTHEGDNYTDHSSDHLADKLEILDLRSCKITKIADNAFAGLDNLLTLVLSNNGLSENTLGISNLKKLRDLDLSNNNFKSLPSNFTKSIPNLRTLNLGNNAFSSVQLGQDIAELTGLQRLDLTNNQLYSISEGDFKYFSNMSSFQTLVLRNCDLTQGMAVTAMKDLPNLTVLDLNGIRTPPINKLIIFIQQLGNYTSKLTELSLSELNLQLDTLPDDLFSTLQDLEFLHLSNNMIKAINGNTFTNLIALVTLNLSYNQLTTMENIVSAGHNKLQNLYLQNNIIDTVKPIQSKVLEEVDLSHNKIQDLPDNFITSCRTLTSLNLRDNEIENLHQTIFSDVMSPNLQLDLSYNKIQNLVKIGSITAKVYNLSHNQIAQITQQSFLYLQDSVRILDMSYNNLTFLGPNTFDFLVLESLDLSHNQLGQAFETGQHIELLLKLKHLRTMDLSNNHITSLPHEQLSNLHSLRTLKLDHNIIDNIIDLNLAFMPNLLQIDLSHNIITTIDRIGLAKLLVLKTIDVSNNPFECDCKMVEFIHWANDSKVNVIGEEDYKCATPDDKTGVLVTTYSQNKDECQHLFKREIPFNWGLLGIVVAIVLATLVAIVLAIHFGHVCQKLRSIKYKWQVRYKEVGDQVEIRDHMVV